MDTGSGKTQIAVLRIAEELARAPVGKVGKSSGKVSPKAVVTASYHCKQLVWFLAPTVVLAEQQYNVITSQLPGYQSRLLLGADKVDLWSEQHIWDSVLLNVRIVVSTHKVSQEWRTSHICVSRTDMFYARRSYLML